MLKVVRILVLYVIWGEDLEAKYIFRLKSL